MKGALTLASVLVAAILAVGAVVGYLTTSAGGNSGAVLEGATPETIAALYPDAEDHPPSEVRMVGGVKEIVVHASEYRFNPDRLDLQEGDRVRLTLVNHGVIEHDLEMVGLTADDAGHTEDGADAHAADEPEVGHDEEQEQAHADDAGGDEGHVEDGVEVHADDADSKAAGHDGEESEDEGEDGHAHAENTISVHALAGETETVEFVVSKAGQYTFICTLPEHKEQGMFGELMVMGGEHEEGME